LSVKEEENQSWIKRDDGMSWRLFFRMVKLTGKSVLFTHGRNDGDKKFLALIKFFLQLLTKFTFGQLDIILGATVIKHQRKETIINVDEGVFVTDNVGDIHVVGGGREIFKLPDLDQSHKLI
jgi:hypothetical protein